MRTINARISFMTGGRPRPRRVLPSDCLAMSLRCHASNVSGVTIVANSCKPPRQIGSTRVGLLSLTSFAIVVSSCWDTSHGWPPFTDAASTHVGPSLTPAFWADYRSSKVTKSLSHLPGRPLDSSVERAKPTKPANWNHQAIGSRQSYHWPGNRKERDRRMRHTLS
jgi:hypothetical protein